MKLLPSLLILVGVAYVGILLVVWVLQERLIFQPSPLPPDHRFEFGSDVHEVWIDRPGPGSARLNALHLRLPAPDGLIFYLHGNAGNLQDWFVGADYWRGLNHDVFMLDYRGYGKSSDRIRSEEQLMNDVRAAWEEVSPRYAGKRRIIFGRSLGTALAATLAAEESPDLVVLASPYESMVAMAGEHYGWVPAALLRYPLRTDEAIARLRSRLLLVHGDRDELIGIHHSERLLARAASAARKQLIRVPGAGHVDLHTFETYLTGLRRAVTSPD